MGRKSLLIYCRAELERSNQIAVSLEEKMSQAEQERQELEEARMKAEEARRMAEEAAHLEKEERDRKVCNLSLLLHIRNVRCSSLSLCFL